MTKQHEEVVEQALLVLVGRILLDLPVEGLPGFPDEALHLASSVELPSAWWIAHKKLYHIHHIIGEKHPEFFITLNKALISAVWEQGK